MGVWGGKGIRRGEIIWLMYTSRVRFRCVCQFKVLHHFGGDGGEGEASVQGHAQHQPIRIRTAPFHGGLRDNTHCPMHPYTNQQPTYPAIAAAPGAHSSVGRHNPQARPPDQEEHQGRGRPHSSTWPPQASYSTTPSPSSWAWPWARGLHGDDGGLAHGGTDVVAGGPPPRRAASLDGPQWRPGCMPKESGPVRRLDNGGSRKGGVSQWAGVVGVGGCPSACWPSNHSVVLPGGASARKGFPHPSPPTAPIKQQHATQPRTHPTPWP